MSTVVWKHDLPAVVNKVDLTVGAKVLHFGEQFGGLHLWEAHDSAERTTEARTFEVVGTGNRHVVDPARYVGTAMVQGGSDVFHLFETTGGAE